MANSYISLYVHIVFSTKERQAMIGPDLQNRLWSYMGGIARENHMKALSIGGMQDIEFLRRNGIDYDERYV
jgi:hypothetical protein